MFKQVFNKLNNQHGEVTMNVLAGLLLFSLVSVAAASFMTTSAQQTALSLRLSSVKTVLENTANSFREGKLALSIGSHQVIRATQFGDLTISVNITQDAGVEKATFGASLDPLKRTHVCGIEDEGSSCTYSHASKVDVFSYGLTSPSWDATVPKTDFYGWNDDSWEIEGQILAVMNAKTGLVTAVIQSDEPITWIGFACLGDAAVVGRQEVSSAVDGWYAIQVNPKVVEGYESLNVPCSVFGTPWALISSRTANDPTVFIQTTVESDL